MFNNLITFIKHRKFPKRCISGVCFVNPDIRTQVLGYHFLHIQYHLDEPHNSVLTFTKLKLSPASPMFGCSPLPHCSECCSSRRLQAPLQHCTAAAPSQPERGGDPDYLCLSLFGCGRGPRDSRV